MKIKSAALMAMLVLSVALVSGCSSYPAGYVASSRPVPTGKSYIQTQTESVTGCDRQIMFLGFGATLGGSAQERALKNALEEAKKTDPAAEALVEMDIQAESMNFGIVLVRTIRVTGKPVKFQ